MRLKMEKKNSLIFINVIPVKKKKKKRIYINLSSAISCVFLLMFWFVFFLLSTSYCRPNPSNMNKSNLKLQFFSFLKKIIIKFLIQK